MTFQDGLVKEYDLAVLFDKYPQLKALKDRQLFLSGKRAGFYGIIWNNDLDLETETVYQYGTTVKQLKPFSKVGDAVLAARAKAGMTQKALSEITGIDQSDISKIERGTANPTIETMEKIAAGLGGELILRIEN